MIAEYKMFISEKKAELIAKLSYEESIYLKNLGIPNYMDAIITYKKALELDKNTAGKILKRLIDRSNEFKLKKIANLDRSRVKHIGHELILIENYQYIDYYKYELNSTKDKAELEIKFINGKTYNFNVVNLKITKTGEIIQKQIYGDTFYIPHIYGSIFLDKEYKTENLTELEMYLKLLIIEDRQINPYILSKENDVKIVLPMKEKTEHFIKHENDIDFLNMLLKKTSGFLTFDISTDLLKIESIIKYLETIKETSLIDSLLEYKNKDKLKTLKYILDIANKEIYGLVVKTSSNQLHLL